MELLRQDRGLTGPAVDTNTAQPLACDAHAIPHAPAYLVSILLLLSNSHTIVQADCIVYVSGEGT
jgi:hypothetical protein